ncbi:MAG TPA: hypothetical protein VFS40_15650, partial [Gemmatimonadales bacterium]|nr:hypothetical protein [Gemmatimonadales bacterium]
GTQRELLHDGVDALLVPPGDETALAEAMTRLAADPALRLRLGAAAAELARGWSVDAWARRLTAVYERLATAGGDAGELQPLCTVERSTPLRPSLQPVVGRSAARVRAARG